MKKGILFLEPVCMHNIWGGTRLREEFGYKVEGQNIGECWGISAHTNGDCVIANGGLAGKRLSEVWRERPELFGYPQEDRFPLLVKIIDASQNLSVQVHPDDTYAMEHGNGSLGKTECWYILDCPTDAEIIVGHNAGSKEELSNMIHQGKWNEFIRRMSVKKGNLLQIDPGTVHAITAGMLILETQQNSDITYRVYDYDRLSGGVPRKLHIEQSIDVITVPAKPPAASVIDTSQVVENELCRLYEGKYYHIFKVNVSGSMYFEQNYSFLNMSVIEGCGNVNGIQVKKGCHFIIPYAFGKVRLHGDMEIVASAPCPKGTCTNSYG